MRVNGAVKGVVGARNKTGGAHVGGNNLLVPREAGEVGAKQVAADLAVGAVAADDVRGLEPLQAGRRLDVGPGLVGVLAGGDDLVLEQHLALSG